MAIEPSDGAEYVGATRHTNNTGELTAMHAMIDRALATPAGRQRVVMNSDSLYAINMTQGVWMPAKRQNHEIIRSLRRKWQRLQRARPGEVTMRHVRSHIGITGNELADYLAGRRETDETEDETLEAARDWLHSWDAQRTRPDHG